MAKLSNKQTSVYIYMYFYYNIFIAVRPRIFVIHVGLLSLSILNTELNFDNRTRNLLTSTAE